jgi:thioredoxin 2
MNDIRVHLPCPHCGATNRLPAARVDDKPTCGKCGQPLLAGQPVALTDADFDAVVDATDCPVLVDFWAAWCGPCRMMAPAFEQAGRQLGERALFVKVDTDANPQLAARFGIRSIPTLVKIERGRETARRSGALPAGEILRMVG